MTLLFNLAGDPHLLLSVADFRVFFGPTDTVLLSRGTLQLDPRNSWDQSRPIRDKAHALSASFAKTGDSRLTAARLNCRGHVDLVVGPLV